MSILGTAGSFYMLILMVLLVVGFGLTGLWILSLLFVPKTMGSIKSEGGNYMNRWLRLAVFSFVGIIISMVVLGLITPGGMSGSSGNMVGIMQQQAPMQGNMTMAQGGNTGMAPMGSSSSSQGGSMGMMNMMPMGGSSMSQGSSGMMPMGNSSMPQGNTSSMQVVPVSNMSAQQGNMVTLQAIQQQLSSMQMQINQMQQQMSSGSMPSGSSSMPSGSSSMPSSSGGGMSMM